MPTRVGPASEAAFLFDPAEIRSANEPPEDAARLIWMFVALARERGVAYEAYAGIFNRTDRTFKRDVAKLRELGERFGFALTKQQRGVVRLARFDGDPRPRRRRAESDEIADTLLAIEEALGEVVGASLRGAADPSTLGADRFLRIATPRMRDDGAVAAVFRELRAAWVRRARVRFAYPDRASRAVERVVEPHLVTYNGGRYYLVGFDVRPRSGGWRQYALDRIVAPIVRAGTFERRSVPHEYRGEDAIGLFKTGRSHRVTIALGALVAEAIRAREWQRAQAFGRHDDGRTTVTFEVHDLGEAVRWALGLGCEAEVLAPSAAVALAREIVETLRHRYSDDAGGAATA